MAWDNAIVPKHAFIAFILWLAIKDRLTTCDILAVWGWQDDVLYGFCRSKKWNARIIFFFFFFFELGITCFLIAHKLILSEGMEAGLVAVAEATYSM